MTFEFPEYPHKIDCSNNKSLQRFRRWLSFRIAKYHLCIKEKEESDKYFVNPENRPLGKDYREAVKNLEVVKHYHWAINEILNFKG